MYKEDLALNNLPLKHCLKIDLVSYPAPAEGLGNMIKGYSAFIKSLLEPHTYTSEFESHWVPLSYGLVPHLSKSLVNFHYWSFTIRLFSVISRTFVGGEELTPRQRSSRSIIQSPPTGQQNILGQIIYFEMYIWFKLIFGSLQIYH